MRQVRSRSGRANVRRHHDATNGWQSCVVPPGFIVRTGGLSGERVLKMSRPVRLRVAPIRCRPGGLVGRVWEPGGSQKEVVARPSRAGVDEYGG